MLPRSSPVPGSTTATVSAPRRAATEVPSSNTASRPIAPSSVATWVASRIGVSTPSAPVRSSSAIVVSSTHSSPESVPMYSWSESGSNATALAPGSSSVPMGLRVWRSRPSTPSPVATHTRSPARVDAPSPSRRGSIAASRTAVVTWLLAATSRPANSVIPPAITYFARCGWVHS